jgi:hypothetical protein
MLVEKVIAFLDNLNSEELDRLSPARRQKFSELCHHWHKLAERRRADQIVKDAKAALEPKSGVLRDLKRGQRIE